MKTHAFLIAAHKFPQLLGSLVRQLDSEQSYFFIHVDAKSIGFMESAEVKELMLRPNVRFVSPRIRLYWGGFSQIKVTLRLIEEALREREFDYFHLLSAQDFLTQSSEEFFRFFESTEYSFLELDDSDQEFPDRMAYYYLNDRIDLSNASTLVRILNQKYNALQSRFRAVFARKSLPMMPYKGASWWSLRAEELNEAVEFLVEHPEYIDRFRSTQCADEIFFQTILFNLPDWTARIKPYSLRYVDWTPLEPDDRLPHVLTFRHKEAIRKSNSFFARKVEPKKSKELLEWFGITVSDNRLHDK